MSITVLSTKNRNDRLWRQQTIATRAHYASFSTYGDIFWRDSFGDGVCWKCRIAFRKRGNYAIIMMDACNHITTCVEGSERFFRHVGEIAMDSDVHDRWLSIIYRCMSCICSVTCNQIVWGCLRIVRFVVYTKMTTGWKGSKNDVFTAFEELKWIAVQGRGMETLFGAV